MVCFSLVQGRGLVHWTGVDDSILTGMYTGHSGLSSLLGRQSGPQLVLATLSFSVITVLEMSKDFDI